MREKICDMRTLLKYGENAVVAYLHETDMPIVERDVKPEPQRHQFVRGRARIDSGR